ncbi:DUF3134 family protein [Leptolyngbya sp. FACHB-321]|uniref:DUF3134 family protein n=1 Tax=Leptolyngbya sp. FACHB-321 TaxID=2692807 RepID=UPI0016899807|nr:DUF3134 family protein [Leptolyngbya sp. FACHB-321]MBD2035108.1 DUF3134 family protein [Leptolyngbya sp. FACHB-321]
MVYNPSLQEEPRNQRTKLIPPNQVEPLLHWLDQTGRLASRGIEAEPDSIGANELIDEIVDANAYNDDDELIDSEDD